MLHSLSRFDGETRMTPFSYLLVFVKHACFIHRLLIDIVGLTFTAHIPIRKYHPAGSYLLSGRNPAPSVGSQFHFL